MDTKTRCDWADPLNDSYIKYHDEEWGVPVTDDQTLFEFLILEGAQAGLSWSTILAKRSGYREAFHNFDPEAVAAMSEAEQESLLSNPAIVRNRLKVQSAVTNAKAFLKVKEEFGSFCRYVWGFVDYKPIQNGWRSVSEVPVTTPVSDALSKDLKKRGFKFVGSTIMYAYMQAIGMVNDHTIDCFRYEEVKSIYFGVCP